MWSALYVSMALIRAIPIVEEECTNKIVSRWFFSNDFSVSL